MSKKKRHVLIVAAVLLILMIIGFLNPDEETPETAAVTLPETTAETEAEAPATTAVPETQPETEAETVQAVPETSAETKADPDDPSGYEAAAYAIAMEIVKNNLTDPKSARFSPLHECSVVKNGDLFGVMGDVTAKNSFGGKEAMQFLVEFNLTDAENYRYDIQYVQIGGETSGEYITLH